MGYPALGSTGLTSSPDYPSGVPSTGTNIVSTVGNLISNPIGGALSLIGGLFGGGGPNVKRINLYLAMLQTWYNEAVSQGDTNAARAIIYYAQGGTPYPEQMQPQANALLMQMQKTAPKVYAAAIAAGAYPKGANDEQTANIPRNPNPSLVGTSSSSGLSLSSLTGGGNSTLLLAGAALAAFAFSKK